VNDRQHSLDEQWTDAMRDGFIAGQAEQARFLANLLAGREVNTEDVLTPEDHPTYSLAVGRGEEAEWLNGWERGLDG
jgi:hypothetical protein